MDNLYENLDNFADETTIAELRQENNDLKTRLEEYAVKLDQLQKEFDMLTSEHKKLEMNYSSLLKTAKAEIERKSQIITKLNIEKDAMVLNSIQNRNTFNNRRYASIDTPVKNHEARFGNSNLTQSSGDSTARPSLPNQSAKERREDNSYSSSNISTSRNIETKLSDIVKNPVGNPNLKSARNNEAKENIRLKDDSQTASARISSRRKSMPVFSMEKFSSDEDELISTGSSKECVTKEQTEIRYLDPWGPSIDKPNMEDKMIGHQKYSTENKTRHSQYDSERYRSRDRHEISKKYRRNYSPGRSRKRSHDRKKGSTERRRRSLDRNVREIHDHSAAYHKRPEYDRRRRLVSPCKDKYHHDYKHRNRDSPRSSERNYPPNFDRYKSRNPDMHAMKHKIPPDYEQSSKRMRLDSIPKHEEERLKIERQVGHLPLDLEHMHGMSCQSPDQTHLETFQSHQTREIKLNASSSLDDPRLLSKKYTLKTHDGKPELSTVGSANIDVKMIDTSNWEMMKKIKMPDALLKKPINSDMPSGLLQRPSTSFQKRNSPDCLSATEIKKSTYTMQNVFIQNEVSTSMPETSNQKQKPLTSTNITEALVQQPCLHDDLISNYPSTQKAMSIDMPDILTQKSTDEVTPVFSTQKTIPTDDIVNEIYMAVETPISSISMDSGKIYDFPNDSHGPKEERNEINTQEKTRQHVTEPQNTKNICQTLSNYKIPRTIHEDTHNTKSRKDILAFDDHNDNQKPNPKLIKKSIVKINDSNKPINDTADKKHTEVRRQNESKLPKRRRSVFPDYVTAKEIIEGDLELSDENSDNTDVQIIKQTQVSGNNQVSDTKDDCLVLHKKQELERINQLKFDFEETSTEKVKEQDLKVKSIEITVTDARKPKARKKALKIKETKEPHVNKDAVSMDKPVKTIENTTKELLGNNNKSLSMDQLVTIKENITKELSEDNVFPLSISKTVKKKDKESKLSTKNKDTAPSIDKPMPKKETRSKEPSENKNSVPMDKPVKKKENKPKQLTNKKETVVLDKPVKKKENKTKESVEPKNTILLEKSGKRKESKKTEFSQNTVHAATSVENQGKRKEPKTKENKFNDLFGDSSSLVSPEDLGLVQTVVVPPENYVELFEDAQDATDISADILTSTEKTEKIVNDATLSNFSINAKNTETPAHMFKPAYQSSQKPANMVTTPLESTINQTMYQNLQPQISPIDKEIVKTVIISTGIQPQPVLGATTQCHFENNKIESDLHVMQCVKPTVLNDIALQALATSTPQKVWQQNVVHSEIDPKFSNVRCSNESEKANIDKAPVHVRSATTNTSQTNDIDAPDVTIFVKRRRKVVKKQ